MNHEERLQFIWKKRLLPGNLLRTTSGMEVEVMFPGEQNGHAGPDFFNARISLGGLVWAGNIEIHHYASQWYLHGHHLDPAYDNVLLHVVHHFDKQVKNSRNRLIPSLVVNPKTSITLCKSEQSRNTKEAPCYLLSSMRARDSKEDWLVSLYKKRLTEKTGEARGILTRYAENREKAHFMAWASGFGLPINRLPFELMAANIPLSMLMDIKENLPQLEALLFGHSGLLGNPHNQDPYTSSLLKKYKLMKNTLPGDPVPSHLWKFLRLRPASFPTLRMAQFAMFIHTHFPVNPDFLHSGSIQEIETKLHLYASSYWNTHYVFGKPSPFSRKRMGQQAIQHLIINAIVPYLHALDEADPLNDGAKRNRNMLLEIKAESNQIIKKWIKFGVKPGNAFESQALLQLHKEYCIPKRCDHCLIGKENRRLPL